MIGAAGIGEVIFALSGVALVTSAAVTWTTMLVARRLTLLDHPNERSSHITPTPTLGGIGIICGTWVGLAYTWYSFEGFAHSVQQFLFPLAAGTGVLAISVLDELRPFRAGEKLALQLMAIAVALWSGLRLEVLSVPFLGDVELPVWVAVMATAAWLLLLTNIFNFMDGIDGLSVTQATSAGIWMAVLLHAIGSSLWPVPAIIAAAAIGFGVFNIPPARIFMGDVGSLFLGFGFASLGVAGQQSGLPLWMFVALFGYYLFDSLYTLARRLFAGENIVTAHRSHLYQRLTQYRGWTHGQVDLALVLVNLVLGASVYASLVACDVLSIAGFSATAAVFVVLAVWLRGGGHSLQ